jgi:hypothetical protein
MNKTKEMPVNPENRIKDSYTFCMLNTEISEHIKMCARYDSILCDSSMSLSEDEIKIFFAHRNEFLIEAHLKLQKLIEYEVAFNAKNVSSKN